MLNYFLLSNFLYFTVSKILKSKTLIVYTSILLVFITFLIIMIFIKKRFKSNKDKVQITTYKEINEDEKTEAKDSVYSKRVPDIEIIKYKDSNETEQKQSTFAKPITIEQNDTKKETNKTQEFVNCQYCGCDNKIENTTCERCGANIKHNN